MFYVHCTEKMCICHRLPSERSVWVPMSLSLESPLTVPQILDQELSLEHRNGWATSVLLIEVPFTTRWRCEWRKQEASHARRSWILGRCRKRTNKQTFSSVDEKDDTIQNWAVFLDFTSTPAIATRSNRLLPNLNCKVKNYACMRRICLLHWQLLTNLKTTLGTWVL
jgi:hypothetical protein